MNIPALYFSLEEEGKQKDDSELCDLRGASIHFLQIQALEKTSL